MTKTDLTDRLRAITKAGDDAERAHITVMMEVGSVVLELFTQREYKSITSAESEVSLALKGMSATRSGAEYVKGCRMFADLRPGHTKLNDAQRNMINRYALSTEDIKILVQMESSRIRETLDDIRRGRHNRQYTIRGYSYRLSQVMNPARVKRRKNYRQKLAIVDTTTNPDFIGGKVIVQGELDRESLTNILANVMTRWPGTADECWDAARSLVQRAG